MTEGKNLPFIALIFGWVVLFSTLDAAAQSIEDRELLVVKAAAVKTVGTKAAARRPPPKKRTADSSLLVKSAPKRPKVPADRTSDLTIETEPNATVVMTLQPSGRGAKPTKRQEIAVNGKAVFDNLNPGKYTLSAEKENFVEQETELTIEPQRTATLNYPLEAIQYQLNIETNVSDGEVRYAPAEKIGENSDGTVKLKPEGNYCIVQIKDSKAKITGLSKDYYTIDINPSKTDLRYEPVKAAITPNLIVDEADETDGLKFVSINLGVKISETEFNTTWSGNEWKLPPGWKMEDKMSTLGLNGVALPQDDQYRYYTDFEMRSTARSLDGKSVSYALRAVDENNYYLVRIGGKKAAEPYRLIFYVVKDGGIKQQLNSFDISAFDSVIDDKKSFSVIVKGKGNTFNISIERKGTPLPVGDVTDSFENFKKGAVGIAGINNSNFEVGLFLVCPKSCMK